MRGSKIVVSNSTPLIYLAKIGRLDIIQKVFERIFIPEAIFEETVIRGKALGMTDASIIERAVEAWIIMIRVKPEVDMEYRFLNENERLGLGEREAIKLCKQLNADFFIADDREARRVSKILNIKPIGTFGVIVQAWRHGLITSGEALQILDELVKAGFRIGSAVYRRILDEIGMIP